MKKLLLSATLLVLLQTSACRKDNLESVFLENYLGNFHFSEHHFINDPLGNLSMDTTFEYDGSITRSSDDKQAQAPTGYMAIDITLPSRVFTSYVNIHGELQTITYHQSGFYGGYLGYDQISFTEYSEYGAIYEGHDRTGTRR